MLESEVPKDGTSNEDSATGNFNMATSDAEVLNDHHCYSPVTASLSESIGQPSPIRHLPQELLLAIFSLLAIEARGELEDAGKKRLYLRDVPWIILPSVCRWWRNTSDMCFDLWTVVNFWTPETTDKLMRKSGSRPLDLVFVSGHYTQFSSQPAVFKRAVKKDLFQRARSIKFMLEDMPDDEYELRRGDWPKVVACSQVLTTILSTPAPKMVSIHLEYTFDFEEMPRNDAPDVELCHRLMGPSDYPVLRQIYLDSWITVAPDDLFLRLPLTSLTLSRGVYFEKFGELLDVLARMPTLVAFKMDNRDNDIFASYEAFDDDNMAEALLRHRRDPGSIELPKLELFELDMCDTDFVVEIMHWVRIPRAASLILKRLPFMSVRAESSAEIQEEVDWICDMLRTCFSAADLEGAPVFHGLEELTAITRTSLDERDRRISTLHIRAQHLCPGGQSEAVHTSAGQASQLDVSLSFCAETFPESVIMDILYSLPLLLGNDATCLQLFPIRSAWRASQTSGQNIYHATANDQTVSMYPLGLKLFESMDDSESSSPPPSPPDAFLPHLAVLDLRKLDPSIPTNQKFGVRLDAIAESLHQRVEAGILREVNFDEGYADRAGVEEMKKRLGDVVKWIGSPCDVS